MDNITVGIIGLGHWGPNILGSLSRIKEVKLKSICDQNTQALIRLSENYESLFKTQDANEIFADNGIDLICIATPVKSHFELAKKALTAGKHVFVEKPLCANSDEGNALVELANKNSVKLMVGHVFLFNPTVIKVKEIIDSGQLGKILYLEAHRTNLGPVRSDVNAIWDLTSHDISIFNYWLSSTPIQISASGSKALDGIVEDTTFVTLKYPDNILAHAHASWLNPMKVRQITIVGQNKMLIWDDVDLTKPIQIFDSNIKVKKDDFSDTFSSHRMEYHRGDIVIPAVTVGEPLKSELGHFVKCLLNKEKLRSDGEFGNQIVKILEASDSSLHDMSRFIKID